MFQFTTTNVINSDKDLTTGKNLWTAEAGKSLNILRVNNFKKENVETVFKAEANDPVLEKVEIDLSNIASDLKKGDQIRLNLYIGLTQASQDSRYSNDMIYKGKPFTVEFLWKGDSTSNLAGLKKTIDKYQVLVYGDKQLDAAIDGDKLVITCKTEFQRFKTVDIDKYTPDNTTYPYSGQYTTLLDLDSDDVTVTAGKEGFGTYSYLLHNLRLPTFERTRFAGINQDETPVVGAKYNQYTIHYCVNRGILGTNAVGDTVKSKTTHVFFVKSDLVSSFEDAIKSAFGITFETEKREQDSADKKVAKDTPNAEGKLFDSKKQD